QNRGGPTFSFMDGPITANGPAGVHHGIGRTLKDVFQRYKAMHGHELRYQNGFDSQGLHVEVQVEKALGFNSKHEIEEYGLARFALRGRADQSLVVWTTTPWTLPANVAAAVKPDAEYGRNDAGEWVAAERYPEEHFEERVRGSELVGLEYDGPFDDLAAQEGV